MINTLSLPVENLVAKLARHETKKHKIREISSIKRIVIHCTDWKIDPWSLAIYNVAPNHISITGCPGITYHELIMPSGKVYKTQSYREITWHVGLWNSGSVAIAMSFKVSNDAGKDTYGPTNKALRSTIIRAGELCLKFKLYPKMVVGHRELRGTGWFWMKGSKRLRKTCPGLKVDLKQLRKEVAIYMQMMLRDRGLYKGKIDGIFGWASKRALWDGNNE